MIAVGIEIAKPTHAACFLGQDGQPIRKSRRFRNTPAGRRAVLDDLQQRPSPATIGLEATGHYWLALHDQLVSAGHTVPGLHPLQTHADRKMTVRKTKTDRKDAWLIADVVRLGRGRAAYVPDEATSSAGARRISNTAHNTHEIADVVGEASLESFPASDPPAWIPIALTPSISHVDAAYT